MRLVLCIHIARYQLAVGTLFVSFALKVYAIAAIEFLDEHLSSFKRFLQSFVINQEDILVPEKSQEALASYKAALMIGLTALKKKRDEHP